MRVTTNNKEREANRVRMAAAYRADPSKFKERSARYREANRERNAAYRARHIDRIRLANREKMRSLYAANPEKYRAKARLRREKIKADPALLEKERARSRLKMRGGLPEPNRQEPGLCECCGGPPNGMGSLCLDHDHITGQFRGWLCFNCNVSIAKLGDSIVGVERALLYLKRAEQ